MKKQLVIISTFILLLSCGQTRKEKSIHDENAVEHNSTLNCKTSDKDSFETVMNSRKETLNREFKKYKIYGLNETLCEDFNGDGIADKAEFVKSNGKTGIIITDGKSKELTKLGFGKKFAHLTDFDWVNYWGVLKDSSTNEVEFDNNSGDILGSKTVQLKNISIFLRQDDNEEGSGGGIITYEDNNYKWIHQTE
jgi:hypothetical protein